MKVTIFGGSGFLGSHVADELGRRGHKVTIFDQNASPFLMEGQDMVIGDVLDADAVREAVKGADAVYNFIALADIDEAWTQPVMTANINVMGNINVLEACRKEKVDRFIFSSSIYVYSDAGSFYRSSKQACELFIENYQKIFGLDYTILRYGSLYGPRSDERNWIYRVLKQAITEKKITRHGDGNEVREYIHVQDAARLSVDILGEKYRNTRLIITGSEQFRIKDLLTMIQEMMKGEIEIEYVDAISNEHYEITPYVFNPQIATKITGNEYLDMGQGILNILGEIHQQHTAKKR